MRTKTFSSLLLGVGLVAFAATTLHAQVGINNTGTTPDASAILDLQTGNGGVNKGFLPQAVALTANNVAAPVTAPATGLIVYNTATAGISPNAVVPGYYYWNGSTWLGLGSPTMGSGTAGWVAVWTPDNNTLGIGSIQDDGTEIGVNSTIYVGWGVSAYGATGGGYFEDGTDYAYLGYVTNGEGVYGYGTSHGGDFADANGEYFYGGDATDAAGGYGVGNTFGVYGADVAGDYGILGNNNLPGNGVFGYGTAVGGYFSNTVTSSSSTDQAYIANSNGNTGLDYGAYFEDADGDYIYEAYDGDANLSSGAKMTIVKDQTGNYRGMTCPEAPEVLFEDYGTSQLVNGKVHIDLDKLFASTVSINEKHPLRVMVTLNDADCSGVAVINRTATGFDVVELNHGISNASFTYQVIANRANSKTYRGVQRDYAERRYQPAPGPMPRPKQIAMAKPAKHVASQGPTQSMKHASHGVSNQASSQGKN